MIQTKLNQYKAQMEQKQVTLEQSDLKNIEILQQKNPGAKSVGSTNGPKKRRNPKIKKESLI